MPVTFDTSAKGIQTATAIAVCTMTIAANACLVVGVVQTSETNGSISACAVNGTPLTQFGRAYNNAAGVIATLFVLTAAPSGAVSISANTVDAGGASNIQIYAASYLGAKAANPFGTVISGTAGAVNNFAISVSTSTTDRVIFFASGINNLTAMNATTRLNDTANFGSFWADTAGPAAAISLSASAVITVQNIAFIGLNIAFSAAAAANATLGGLTLMGVGQ
jgi:hypothetical protein